MDPVQTMVLVMVNNVVHGNNSLAILQLSISAVNAMKVCLLGTKKPFQYMILGQARAYGGCVGEDAYAAADDASCGEKCEAFCSALTSNTQVK